MLNSTCLLTLVPLLIMSIYQKFQNLYIFSKLQFLAYLIKRGKLYIGVN